MSLVAVRFAVRSAVRFAVDFSTRDDEVEFFKRLLFLPPAADPLAGDLPQRLFFAEWPACATSSASCQPMAHVLLTFADPTRKL